MRSKRLRALFRLTLIVLAVLLSATAHAAQRQVLADGDGDVTVVPTRSSAPAVPDCGNSTAPLSAVPFRFHEDSSIQTRIDLNALDLAEYAFLGVQVAREDGLDYFPVGPPFTEGAQLRSLTPGGCFDRVFSQLKPGRTYDICLIGLMADFTSTGLFACVSVTTKPKKPETALLITNSNTKSLDRTIDKWMRHVKEANPDLKVRRVNVPSGISVRRLWDVIHAHYVKSNLTTVILGSPGLPLPVVDNFGAQVQYSGVYTSLSRKFMADDGFLNPTNDLREVSIATWNAPPRQSSATSAG
jgi:hypothetical protein